MVDSVLASQARNASGVGKAERASVRDPVGSVRPASSGVERAFGAGLAEASPILQPPSNDQTSANDQTPVGNGLLSTSVQILLAETRSQEALAPFAPSSRFGQAINSYTETQSQVRETIRTNTGSTAPQGALGIAVANPAPESVPPEQPAPEAGTVNSVSTAIAPAVPQAGTLITV